VAVNPRDILQIVRSDSGFNTIFNLAIQGGETTPVMVVDHQNDPIKNTLLHADLKRIDLTKRIRVTVPIHIVGEPKGVKTQGGHLEVVVRSVDVECLPDDIPGSFTIDMTETLLNESKRASDLPLTGSMKLLSPSEALLAHVIALKAEEVATPAEGDAAATPAAGSEPEVIKKGKKEEEAADEKKKK
jgi:large subunit ribosomal protein L25